MRIEIQNRWSGEVIFSHEQENNSTKITIELAVKARVNLAGANLAGAYLAGANLAGAYLDRANLEGAYLEGANLAVANLAGANLAGAYLDRAYLAGAYLDRANLEGAYLAGVNLAGANLDRVNLDGANLEGANLAGAYLDRANLEGATYGIATLKNGLLQLLGKCWPVFIFDAHIKIGCQIHSTNDWESFDDERISEMEVNALKFWKENKAIILTLAKHHQNQASEAA